MTEKIKIAFLDRDGVINQNAAPHEYITRPEDFVFNDGIFDLLAKLKTQGFQFIIISNQRGIARGKYSEEDLVNIHQKMTAELAARDFPVLDIFYCPHEENTCNCRKPRPGMLEQACAKHDIDKAHSILVSDSPEDVSMGEKFGLADSYLVPQNHPNQIQFRI